METLKNLFFFVGSLLGIAAFCKNALDPILESNRKRWAAIADRVSEDDLRNLEWDLWNRYRIDSRVLDRVEGLVRDMEDEAEAVRFGPLLRQSYSDALTRFVTRYNDLRDYVCAPFWQPEEVGNEEEKYFEYWLNKKHFHSPEYTGQPYSEHIRAALKIAEAMRVEYRTLSILSSLTAFELPVATRIVSTRAALPKGR